MGERKDNTPGRELNMRFWESLDAVNLLPDDLKESLIIARDFGDSELGDHHKKVLLFFEEELDRGKQNSTKENKEPV